MNTVFKFYFQAWVLMAVSSAFAVYWLSRRREAVQGAVKVLRGAFLAGFWVLFIMGLFYFDWQNLPEDIVLLAHLTMVLLLMFIFPYSKLLHVPGLFMAPTRYQLDNPREQRHLSPWGAELEAEDGRNS